MVSWYATEYWSAGEFVSSFFKWAKTDSWTVSNETPNFDATYIWKWSSISTRLNSMILRVVSQLRNLLRYMLLDSLFLYLVLLPDLETNLLASQPKNALSRDLYINSYLEPRMFYDVTDSGSFHGIDLEHLSDQVCYWRIFYMFWRFVNSSFNLKNSLFFIRPWDPLILIFFTFWKSLFVLSSSKGSVPQSKA